MVLLKFNLKTYEEELQVLNFLRKMLIEEITKRINSLRVKCNKHKHTLRTNKFGVTWCVGCGLLSASIAKPLKEEDKLIYTHE